MLLQGQSVYVSVAHRYWVPQWSPEQNRSVYGDQASADGVGSNLRLTVEAETDPTARLGVLKKLIDHQNLFVNFVEFKQRPSTLENITLFLIGQLAGDWQRLTVAENDNLACVFEKGQAYVTVVEKLLNLTFHVRRSVDPISGLGLRRGELMLVLRQVAPQFAEAGGVSERAWGQQLFARFAAEVKGLQELSIDLAGQRGLRLIAEGKSAL
jgi:hypothetical protein